MRESQIQTAIIEYLKWQGCIVTRVNSGSILKTSTRRDGSQATYRIALADKGTADVIACMPGGKFLAVETKTPKGRLSIEQMIFCQQVEDAGGTYVCARSVDDVIPLFEKKGRR